MTDLINLILDENRYLHDDIYNNLWVTSVNPDTNLVSERFWYPVSSTQSRFQFNSKTSSIDDSVSYERGYIYLKENNLPIRDSQYLKSFEFILSCRIWPLQHGMLLHAGYNKTNPLDYCFYLWVDAMTDTSFNLGIWSKDDTYGATLNCTGLSIYPPANGYQWMTIKVLGDGEKMTLSIVEYPQYGEVSIPFSMYNVKGGINLGQTPNNSEALGCAARCDFLQLKGSYYSENILKVY